MIPAIGDAAVFPFPPDGNTPIRMTRSWLTDILSAEDDTEVRIATRDQPVRRMAFTAAFTDAREAGAFRALWYAAAQPLRFLVPLWREQAEPTGIAGAVIMCDTTLRRFVEGERAILWMWTGTEIVWEVVDIVTVTDTDITVADPVTTDFIIGATYCYPLMAAWLEPPTLDLRGYTADVCPLVFHEELPAIAGIDSAITGVVTPDVDTVTIYSVEGVQPYARRESTLLVKARDADGVALVDPDAAWSIDVVDANLILVPSIDRQMARLKVLPGAPSPAFVTATVGGVDAVVQVT